MTRTEKQNQIIENGIFNCNANFYIEATTGFGKTKMFIDTIHKLILLYNIKKIHVIVPTIDLLEQTKKKLIKLPTVEVFVINSYVKSNHIVDLLIADECHIYTSSTATLFNLLIDRTYFKYSCFVSATLQQEHKDFLRDNKIKCAGIITREEALENEWISNYTSYVLMLDMNKIDEIEHQSLNNKIRTAFSFFNSKDSFKLIMKGLSDKEFRTNYALSKNITEGQLFIICKNALTAIQKRKFLLSESDTKLKSILEITNTFKMKGLIFGQSTKFADNIANQININNNKEICVSVHSKKKAKENKEAIKKLTDNRYNISLLSSAKKVTTGIDIPDLQLGIIAGFTSSEITITQILGKHFANTYLIR